VASPRLEDVDLSGARGILVNVTAGLDMAIGEFEEVGNTIKAFASENATVVVGTVIDPEMSDELRVTVVATGLGQGNASVAGQPVKLVVNKASGEEIEVDYDRPTVLRNQAKSGTPAVSDEKSMEYLDIPAFLRRQAD
jgi:cell division protein FtsZ